MFGYFDEFPKKHNCPYMVAQNCDIAAWTFCVCHWSDEGLAHCPGRQSQMREIQTVLLAGPGYNGDNYADDNGRNPIFEWWWWKK